MVKIRSKFMSTEIAPKIINGVPMDNHESTYMEEVKITPIDCVATLQDIKTVMRIASIIINHKTDIVTCYVGYNCCLLYQHILFTCHYS